MQWAFSTCKCGGKRVCLGHAKKKIKKREKKKKQKQQSNLKNQHCETTQDTRCSSRRRRMLCCQPGYSQRDAPAPNKPFWGQHGNAQGTGLCPWSIPIPGWEGMAAAQPGTARSFGSWRSSAKGEEGAHFAWLYLFFFFWHPPSPPQQLPKSPGKPKPPGRLLPWREAVGGKTQNLLQKKKRENQRIQCPKLTRNSNGGAMSKSSWLRPLY